ncbi:MAG TPA: hypothetical protein VEU47_12665 [Candidatus Cybelea sp.]|nr:hypothetical protein [Candidatus Cybelea sp.]
MRKLALGLGATIALLAVSAMPAAAKQLVVVKSTAAAFKPGQIVDSNVALALPDNTMVTLIGPDGRNMTLTGPFNGKPAAGGGNDDPALVSKLSHILDQQGSDSSAVGSIRGGPSATPPDAWSIDVDGSGTWCVRDSSTIRLWRHDPNRPQQANMRNAAAGDGVAVHWNAGAASVPWPASLPAAEGKYLVRMPGHSLPIVLQLHQVPADLPTDAHRAVWMNDNGCSGQASRLLTAAH